jgi:DNA-binding MarR family transcriptional regulator
MSEEALKKIEKQNEVMISLLGRMAFTPERVRELVTKNKKKSPEKYVDGYNACDGNKNVNEIAAVIGVDPSTLSPILKDWEEFGIIFEVDKPRGTFYKKLFPI